MQGTLGRLTLGRVGLAQVIESGGVGAGSFTADAIIAAPAAGSFTLDADIIGRSFTIDAQLAGTAIGSFTVDAVRAAPVEGSFGVDAKLVVTVEGSFGVDAAFVETMGQLIEDEYTDTEVATWGKPDKKGGRYTYNANEGEYSKDGTKGTIRNNAVNQYVYAQEQRLDKNIWLQHDLSDRPVNIGVEMRLGINSIAYVKHYISPSGAADHDRIELWVGGSQVGQYGDEDTSVTWDGNWWNTRVRHTGNSYKVKLWREGNPEPDWQITYTGGAAAAALSYIFTTGHNWFGTNGHPWYWHFRRWGIRDPQFDVELDAVLSKSRAGSFTSDAVLSATVASSFSLDVVVGSAARPSLGLSQPTRSSAARRATASRRMRSSPRPPLAPRNWML